MKEIQQQFYALLKAYDRQGALALALDLLQNQGVGIPQLYEQVLVPSLAGIQVLRKEEGEKIWQEHAMTAIVRTVVECAYPYVLRQKNRQNTENSRRQVVVACPEEEYHELGARMGADFFILENYPVCFVGANTPRSNMLSLCQSLQPSIFALSVTSFYHLPGVKQTALALQQLEAPPLVVLSGSVFHNTDVDLGEFPGCRLVQSYADVQQMGGERA